MINKIKLFTVTAILLTATIFHSSSDAYAQDIPELHMLVLQGNIFVGGTSNSALDGLLLEAKIDNQIVGTAIVASQTASSRYISLEVGPDEALEGRDIEFWIGNQMATELEPFGPLTPSGTYCKGCSWVLPLSRTVDLNFSAFPVATPTPVPSPASPAFLTGNVIFGSVLSAPDELTEIEAYIDSELVGTGTVKGPDFSITIDPGTVEYLGKQVIFKIAGTPSKTSYLFTADDFQTDFKLFFPEYIPPPATATPIPLSTLVPTATPIPEPTRTPTPLPEPTPTYTATPTPTPIVFTSSTEEDILIEEASDGGCNSRGGGPASIGLILLSLTPVYLLNRKRRNK